MTPKNFNFFSWLQISLRSFYIFYAAKQRSRGCGPLPQEHGRLQGLSDGRHVRRREDQETQDQSARRAKGKRGKIIHTTVYLPNKIIFL